MTSGRKQSTPSTPPPAKPPDPVSEWYYENGVLKSQRVYDKKKKGYTSETFLSPEEQAIQENATKFLGEAVTGAQNAFNMTPEQIAQYRQAYTDPQKRALQDSFNQASGQFNTAAAASGMRGSVGAADYLARKLEGEKARGLADIEQSGEMMEFQLPQLALAPYMDLFNLYTGAAAGQNQNQAANLEPAFQGSQAGSNFALGNYNNQLNYTNTMNSMNQPRSGGFLSRLFGGF